MFGGKIIIKKKTFGLASSSAYKLPHLLPWIMICWVSLSLITTSTFENSNLEG
jgi:hypothetical protein